MNLIIVGSCSDTSALARGLNKRLSNSLVYRHDLLASLKNVPFGNISDIRLDDVGEYLGDIEAIDLKKVEKNALDAFENMFDFLAKSRSKASMSFEKMLVQESLNRFSKRVTVFNTVSLAVINIFSGVVNKEMLKELINLVDDSLVINLNHKKNPLIDLKINENDIIELIENEEKSNFLGTFPDIDALLISDEFKALFSDIKEIEVKPEETKKVTRDDFDQAVHHVIHGGTTIDQVMPATAA